ncbi:hypothetical protein [Candidatus Pyrohabitans sp.]
MLLAALSAGVVSDLKLALVFGMSVFSGVGCISVAATLRKKFYAVALVYLAVGALSLIVAVFADAIRSAIFPQFYLFSALLLITLGLEFLGINVGIRAKEVAKVGIAVALIYSMLHIPDGLSMKLESHTIRFVLLSVGTGFLSTLLGGIFLYRRTNPEILRIISGVILVILGVKLL